jgi:hypothetical protein
MHLLPSSLKQQRQRQQASGGAVTDFMAQSICMQLML